MRLDSGRIPPVPTHLSRAARAFWRSVARTYELSGHHYELLRLACEALDRAEQARTIVAKDGIVTTDRFGQRVTHPAVAVERDSRASAMRLIRSLELDIEPPGPAGRRPKGY